jgi:hypothetical protein
MTICSIYFELVLRENARKKVCLEKEPPTTIWVLREYKVAVNQLKLGYRAGQAYMQTWSTFNLYVSDSCTTAKHSKTTVFSANRKDFQQNNSEICYFQKELISEKTFPCYTSAADIKKFYNATIHNKWGST